jgi:hypothetical protein
MAMQDVMISCPYTREPVRTGMKMTPVMLERVAARPALNPRCVRCSACGRLHTWARPDAWLEGETPLVAEPQAR